MKRFCILLTIALCTGGCYRYEVAQNPTPGSDVRVRLTTTAAVSRSQGYDEPVLFFNGRLVRDEPEAITLDILIARDPSQFRNVEIRDTVTLQRAELQSLMVRELAPARSIVFTVALGAGAFALVKGISTIVGGNEGDGQDPGNQAARVPLFALQQRRGAITLQLPFR